MNNEEIKKFAEDYADTLSGEGDYFEEIEKAVKYGISIALSYNPKCECLPYENLSYHDVCGENCINIKNVTH